MTNYEAIAEDYKRKLQKALAHLEYSHRKVASLPHEVAGLDEETLEAWEGFSARFARVADLFLARYVRAMVLKNDPGFQGTLRDFVNQGEKLGLVDDANAWMGIRELRNISAHDYTEEELSEFFSRLRAEAPRLLALKKLLK